MDSRAKNYAADANAAPDCIVGDFGCSPDCIFWVYGCMAPKASETTFLTWNLP